MDSGPSLLAFIKSTTDWGRNSNKKKQTKKKTKNKEEKQNDTPRGQRVSLFFSKTGVLREADVSLALFASTGKRLQLKDVQLCSARALLSPSVSGACLSLALSAPRQLIGFTHEVGAGSHHSRALMKATKYIYIYI